jgi:hypothetical protein
MEAVVQRLREMFPLLSRLSVLDADAQHWDILPPYLGMIWSVLDGSPQTPVCFVFPRRGEIARLAAVTHCLNKLSQIHRDAVLKTSISQFTPGDNVLVHPSREVFVYRGPHESFADKFCLGELDRHPSITLGMPISALRRLELTQRKRPKGDVGKARQLLHPPKAALDLLLDTDTYGNLSTVLNQVLLLDSNGGFAEFADRLRLQSTIPIPDSPSAKAMLPFGTLEQQPAKFQKWDTASVAGEPILAVTNSAEILANHCREQPLASKLVLVNGLGRLRDIQSYDDIAGHQHLVLFADQDEGEMIDILAKRGCRFWYLQGSELLYGANGAGTSSLFGSVVRWARNNERLIIDEAGCEDSRIDDIFLDLDKLSVDITASEDGPVARMISWVWATFGRLRRSLGPPSPDERNRMLTEIEAFRLDIQRYGAWMKSEMSAGLTTLAHSLTAAYSADRPVGLAKGAVLKGVISEALRKGEKIALLAKNENNVAEIRQWIYERAFPANLGVFSARTLPDNEAFDRLLCTSWPSGDMMMQITSRLAAPRITVVGYPCECRWLKQSRSRIAWRPSIGGLSGEDKAAFINRGDGKVKIGWPSATRAMSPDKSDPDPDIWDFEKRIRGVRVGLASQPTKALETVPSRYVRFTGEHYAFLTDTHKVPVATELLSGQTRNNQKLPERTLNDIKLGDFVVFPASGGRQLVQVLADKILGRLAAGLRQRARTWQQALHSSKLTPERFRLTANSLNMHRHPVTIRNWFEDNDQIGPRDKDDLILIAIVTEDSHFEMLIDDTWEAIKTLRSEHLSAGMRLRDVLLQQLPAVLGRIEENGTEIDLAELGSAWVVQVDAIAERHEPRGKAEINRLLAENITDSAAFYL